MRLRRLSVMLGKSLICLIKKILWFALPTSIASNSVFFKLWNNGKANKCIFKSYQRINLYVPKYLE